MTSNKTVYADEHYKCQVEVYLLQLLLGILGGNSSHLGHHALDTGSQGVLIVVDVELLYGVEAVQQPLKIVRYGEGG